MLFVTFYFCYLEVLKKIKVQFKLKIPYVPAKNYMFYSRARVGVGAGKKYGSIKKKTSSGNPRLSAKIKL